MRIVLTNDDGIEARGILEMRRALERVGDVITVAPDQNRSGVGRSISIGRPLTVEEREMSDGTMAYACSGTPVDCVRIVALGLLDFEPDIVVSGINHGENLGDDITYSGTVAAAMEGIVLGIPGIAVSLSTGRAWHSGAKDDEKIPNSFATPEEMDFEPVARFAAGLAKVALTNLPKERILNVNAPNVSAEGLRGVRVTKLGRRRYMDEVVEIKDEEGRISYDIYNNVPEHEEAEGTDFAALGAGEISVTPIHLDLTDRPGIEELSGWDMDGIFENGKQDR